MNETLLQVCIILFIVSVAFTIISLYHKSNASFEDEAASMFVFMPWAAFFISLLALFTF